MEPPASSPATQAACASPLFNHQALASVSSVFPRSWRLNAKKTRELNRATSKRGKVSSFVDRWYFTGVAAIMLVSSLAAFLPSILHPAGRRAPIDGLVAFHGFVFFAWLGFYFVQNWLVATGRTQWHRKLGRIGIVLLVIMIPLGVMTNAAMVHRGFDLSGALGVDPHPKPGNLDAISMSVFTLTTLFGFGVLAAASLTFAYLRRFDAHKRLMMFANVLLVTAADPHLRAHFPQLWWWDVVSWFTFVLSLWARDYIVEKRIKKLSLILGVVMTAGVLTQVAVATSKTRTGVHRLIERMYHVELELPATSKPLHAAA